LTGNPRAGLKAADIEKHDRATDSWPGAKSGLLAPKFIAREVLMIDPNRPSGLLSEWPTNRELAGLF